MRFYNPSFVSASCLPANSGNQLHQRHQKSSSQRRNYRCPDFSGIDSPILGLRRHRRCPQTGAPICSGTSNFPKSVIYNHNCSYVSPSQSSHSLPHYDTNEDENDLDCDPNNEDEDECCYSSYQSNSSPCSKPPCEEKQSQHRPQCTPVTGLFNHSVYDPFRHIGLPMRKRYIYRDTANLLDQVEMLCYLFISFVNGIFCLLIMPKYFQIINLNPKD